jgi:hypothetical protein
MSRQNHSQSHSRKTKVIPPVPMMIDTAVTRGNEVHRRTPAILRSVPGAALTIECQRWNLDRQY